MSNPASLPPGFRFHPTDEELILHYLKNRASSSPCPVPIIAEVDIYKHNPWDLPAKAAYGDREWYFFSPRDRKYPNGFRPNRSAASGYWKATGTDKPIRTSKGRENIGVKKALVFYKGRPPKGMKTNWIMHEYRLAEAHSSNSYKPIMKPSDSSMRLDDWVLCRIYKKKSHLQPLSTPLMDHEQVGSGLDDIYSSSSKNWEQQSTLRLQKSSSISDLLENYSAVSHLFESENGTSLMAQQPHCAAQLLACNGSRINGNNSLVQQQTQTKPSFLTAESSMERQRMMEHCFDGSNWFLHPSMRHNSNLLANSSEQLVDGNLLEQQYLFDQQLLLNSHLGLH